MPDAGHSSPLHQHDGHLMAAYVAGDDLAFGELFSRYGGSVFARMRRAVGSAAARDLTQQAFLQVHRARRDFRADAPFTPWLMTIAQNVLRDHLRRNARRPAISALVEEPAAPSRSQSATEARDSIDAALNQLPPTQSAVVRRHWLEDRSYSEIARELGITPGAAKVRAHRAYQALRRILFAQESED